MNRLRIASFAMALVAASCGALAAWAYERHLAMPAPGDLTIDSPIKSLGTVPPRTTVRVPFRFTNRGRGPIRVVGGTFTCSAVACIEAEGLPFTIPPGETREVVVVTETKNPGHCDRTIAIFTDCPGWKSLELTVRGEVDGPTPSPVASSSP